MSRPKARFPTELELLILKIFWNHGAMPVRHVRSLLETEASRPLAHTSVVTTLNTMVQKGYLSRIMEGNAYTFSAETREKEVSSGILEDILKRVFDGSAKSLVLSLLESESISREEHEALKQLIKNQRDDQKEMPKP